MSRDTSEVCKWPIARPLRKGGHICIGPARYDSLYLEEVSFLFLRPELEVLTVLSCCIVKLALVARTYWFLCPSPLFVARWIYVAINTYHRESDVINIYFRTVCASKEIRLRSTQNWRGLAQCFIETKIRSQSFQARQIFVQVSQALLCCKQVKPLAFWRHFVFSWYVVHLMKETSELTLITWGRVKSILALC